MLTTGQLSLIELAEKCGEDRYQYCDTVFRLMPSKRDVPVCSMFTERLKVLTDIMLCSSNKYPISVIRTCNNRTVRLVCLELVEEEHDVFCHLMDCLHKPDCKLQEYIAGPVRSQGNILPLLDMALYYGYATLAAICRNEMGFLVRELLDTESISDGLSIVEMLSKWRPNAEGEDASFQCRGGIQLRRHPVIRQCMHYLRTVPYKRLVNSAQDLAKLPSVVLIYLIIFAGIDYMLKRPLFARALKLRASQLMVESQIKASGLDRISACEIKSEMNWDRVIMSFFAASEETIITSIHSEWLQTMKTSTPHRTMTRTRSADSRTTQWSKLNNDIAATRRRAESMPLMNVLTPTPPMAVSDGDDDPMELDDNSRQHVRPVTTLSYIDFTDMVRMPALSTPTRATLIECSVVVSTRFELSKTGCNNYASPEMSYPLPSNLDPYINPGQRGTLVLSMHTSPHNNELILVATIPQQRMFRNINASILVDTDTDPYMDESTAFTEPRPTNTTICYRQPLVISRNSINIPVHSPAVTRINRPQTMNVGVYVKITFHIDQNVR